MSEKSIGPNSVVQELFISTWVDEVGAFGMKGWGKSWAILQESIYDINQPDYSEIIFRRTSTDFEDLWNKAQAHYAPLKGVPNGQHHIISFPPGARIRFGHLQHAKDVFKYDGQEFQRIKYDELMQFPEFMYLMGFSWLRGTNPAIPKKIKSTGNFIGEGKAFVKKRFCDVLKPWKATDKGDSIIPGDVSWFTSINGKDTRAPIDLEKRIFKLREEYPKTWRTHKANDPEIAPYISRMWIFGDRKHNTTLMMADPGYEASLDQLPEREKNAYKYGLIDSDDPKHQLIKTKWWEKAVGGDVKPIPGKKAFGFDYAGVGKDQCVLVHGEGNQVKQIKEWDYLKHEDARDMIIAHFDEHGKYQIKGGIDANGQGSGVYTMLQTAGYTSRINPMLYKDKSFKDKKEYQTTMRFDNLRSQIWYKFQFDMERGKIDLSYLCSMAGLYEKFAKLEEEVLSMRAVQKGSIYKVIPKEELKKADISQEWGGGIGLRRSPDRADALVYWWWVHDWTAEDVEIELPKHARDYIPEEEEEHASPYT